ncbi:hypothetical protein Nepgr_025133 [Nepenthes gracilis]|uniref:C2H2-type domain-containing protein n=1 Tax=Nepenthes gracilis TaxID=150966 RepID=A0AAD3T592_NEPGR|nr:hypothetical protein Nepgr_025133 [Nepenthes gracilis]
MDFKSRFPFNGPAAHNSTPWNYTYFTNQRIRAGYRSTDFWDIEFQRHHYDVREAVLRGFEKEQIRAEIIAEELACRRIVEQEVRRELMCEREMTMRKAESFSEFGSRAVCLDERVPPSTDFDNRISEERLGFPSNREVLEGFEALPFQRCPLAVGDSNVRSHEVKSPSEIGKKMVITLMRPDTSLSGLKRKAPTPPTSIDVELPSTVIKKKPKEEWSCTLCHVTAICERSLNEHLQGKRHKAKAAGLVAQTTSHSTSPSLKKSAPSSAASPIEASPSTVSMEKPKVELSCAVCHASAVCERRFNEHIEGKKNKAKAASLVAQRIGLGTGPLPKKTASSTAAIAVDAPSTVSREKPKEELSCALCHVTAMCERTLNEHLEGKKHKTKAAGMIAKRTGLTSSPLPKKISPSSAAIGVEAGPSTVSKKKPKEQLSCASCHVNGLCERRLNEHLEGTKHKMNAAALVGPRTCLRTGPLLKKTAPPSTAAIDVEGPSTTCNEKPKEQLSCALCHVNGLCERRLNEHLEGKKHKAKTAALVTLRPGLGTCPLLTKTAPSSAAIAVDTSSTVSKEKPKEELNCAVCHVTALSERSLNEHLEGKKHKAKAAALAAQRRGLSTNLLPKKTAPSSTGISAKAPSTVYTEKPKGEFTCALCHVTAVCKRNLNEHLQGKKHKAKARRNCFNTSPLPKRSVPTIDSTSSLKLTVQANVGSSETKGDDSISEQEKQTDIEKSSVKFGTKLLQKTKKDVLPKEKGEFQYWCAMCEVGTHCGKVMNDHKRGTKHLMKLVRQLEKTPAATSAGTNSVELLIKCVEKVLRVAANDTQDVDGEMKEMNVNGIIVGEMEI